MTDYPFTTDGCSGLTFWVWRKLVGPPPWEGDCVEHDRAYWPGGSRLERLRADAALMLQVAEHGWPTLAVLMFLGVRLGGHPLLPFPWRWGYGWRWPHRY